MIDDDNNAQDEQGHGTHVAGTVAADLSEISSQDNDLARDAGSGDRALERDSPERSDRRVVEERPNRQRPRVQ
jgi:hypothetical protein